MPSVSLSKVHKHISKKRSSMDAMHENSRDAKRLRRAGSREERLSHHASMTLKARQPYRQYNAQNYESHCDNLTLD
jgi:translation machinery-associated protein 16